MASLRMNGRKFERMKKIKRFAILALCAALIAAILVGCAPAPQGGAASGSYAEAPTSASGPAESHAESLAAPVDGELSIQFINVGQADAALISCDGEYMLVDGGNAPDSNIIYTVLTRNGTGDLKYVIGTHAHEDHIGGLPGAFQAASVETVLCPVMEYDSKAFRNFKDCADQCGGIVVPSVGDTYTLGGASFQILAVNDVPNDTNNTSIVFKLTYGNTSFLFTGDAEREVEEQILDAGFDISADVLKVGHHGSSSSTSYPFLREVMPTYAVISCEIGNSYGHPHDETLSKLRDAGVTLYRTDLQGDIFCTSDGENISFSTQQGASAEEVNPTIEEQTANTPTQPDGYTGRYIGNVNSLKVHTENCVNLPAEKNRVYFDSLQEALDAGYEPCGSCMN